MYKVFAIPSSIPVLFFSLTTDFYSKNMGTEIKTQFKMQRVAHFIQNPV